MNQIFTVAKQIIAYGADHPGLLGVAVALTAVVGFIAYHTSKGN